MSGFLAGKVWLSDLDPELKPLAASLADIGNDDGSSIYPSIAYMAWRLGASSRTVDRHLAKLRELGILLVVSQGGGRTHTTEYEMHEEKLPKRDPWKARQNDAVSEETTTSETETTTSETGNHDTAVASEPSLTVNEPSIVPLTKMLGRSSAQADLPASVGKSSGEGRQHGLPRTVLEPSLEPSVPLMYPKPEKRPRKSQSFQRRDFVPRTQEPRRDYAAERKANRDREIAEQNARVLASLQARHR